MWKGKFRLNQYACSRKCALGTSLNTNLMLKYPILVSTKLDCLSLMFGFHCELHKRSTTHKLTKISNNKNNIDVEMCGAHVIRFFLSLSLHSECGILSSESAAYHQDRSMKSLLEIWASSPIRMYHFFQWQVLNKIVKFRQTYRKCSE